MMTLDDLIAFGANVDEGLSRCMGNESFYLRLVEMAKSDEGVANLQAAIQDNRLKDAFEAAHALKGVLGNLSLTPLFEPVNEITELLRVETQTDYTELVDTISQQWQKFCAL